MADTSKSTGKTFTCFPNLPAELRETIWKYCANLPRNLDVWIVYMENASYSWRMGRQERNYRTFKFFTTQPLPGVFLASKESHAVAAQYYHLGFSTRRCHGNILLPQMTSPRILVNFSADRACPMNVYDVEPAVEMCRVASPLSCAVNVYTAMTAPMLEDPLMSAQFSGDGFHEEILLYSCKALIPRPGYFDFVDIDEDSSPPGVWKVLSYSSQKLMRMIHNWQRFEEQKSKASKPKPKARPRIRFVAIVVDGIMRY